MIDQAKLNELIYFAKTYESALESYKDSLNAIAYELEIKPEVLRKAIDATIKDKKDDSIEDAKQLIKLLV